MVDCHASAATAIATGMSVSTVKAGVVELEQPEEHLQEPATERQRRPGAGRPPVTETQPAVGEALDALVEPVTRGEPTSPLRWTAKSAEKLAAELKNQGFSISPDTVERLLRAQGYSLQSTRKRFEGKENLDRDAQFDYIAKTCQSHIDQDLPAVSIDTKAKN